MKSAMPPRGGVQQAVQRRQGAPNMPQQAPRGLMGRVQQYAQQQAPGISGPQVRQNVNQRQHASRPPMPPQNRMANQLRNQPMPGGMNGGSPKNMSSPAQARAGYLMNPMLGQIMDKRAGRQTALERARSAKSSGAPQGM